MDHQSAQLNVKGDSNFKLGRKELPGGIEHAHGPDSRDHHTAVVSSNYRDGRVLVDSDENLISTTEDDYYGDHDNCTHHFASV